MGPVHFMEISFFMAMKKNSIKMDLIGPGWQSKIQVRFTGPFLGVLGFNGKTKTSMKNKNFHEMCPTPYNFSSNK